ncbi:hypothetical protein [Streptomyces sp. CC208A]|uniref:hypothetical protein n=1 Tax=Streptomyces sp. CC208A TaxID=3044573 RepID=UPI0024A97138|nr:hypothetical protein [Streptomyces sp. CC208A]
MNCIARLLELLLRFFRPSAGRHRVAVLPPVVLEPDTPTTLPLPHVPVLWCDDVVLARPYPVEHERRQERARQRRRRLTLVLAADFGIDLDTRVLHGAGVSR